MKKKIISMGLMVFIIFPILSQCVLADTYIWPLNGFSTVTSYFGYRSDPFSGEQKGHGGIDIATNRGTPVYASSSGTLTVGYTSCTHNYNSTCGCGGGYGNYVYIDDDNGIRVYYAHLTSVTVSDGRVEQGQQIGTAGSTGNSTCNHLHFEMRTGTAIDTRVDPLDYVDVPPQKFAILRNPRRLLKLALTAGVLWLMKIFIIL